MPASAASHQRTPIPSSIEAAATLANAPTDQVRQNLIQPQNIPFGPVSFWSR